MCFENLTFGFHTVIKLISLPRKMFFSDLEMLITFFFNYLVLSPHHHWFGAKNTVQPEVCYYSPICACSEHTGVPFLKDNTEFSAMITADPIGLSIF